MQSDWPLVIEGDAGIRPATRDDGCFYCHQTIGQPHSNDCVVVKKKIRVRYIYELELEVPHFWDKDNFEFHRNEGSWCADNGIRELMEFFGFDDDSYEGGCSCSNFQAEYVTTVDDTPKRLVKKGTSGSTSTGGRG